MLQELLNERHLPDLLAGGKNRAERRAEIIELLLSEEYGRLNCPASETSYRVVKEDAHYAGDKAIFRRVEITVTFQESLPDYGDRFSFCINAVIPKTHDQVPFFVHAAYLDSTQTWLLPIEEMIDRGFAYFSFNYREITEDLSAVPVTGKEYPKGILPFINAHATDNHAGTLLCWAWACCRTLDYALSCPEILPEGAAVVGHSRLGKTALLAGMIDERFQYVIANNSGCAGAALYRCNKGENIHNIAEAFPYWFCSHYLQYERVPEALPFDQHFLIAACVPRHVYITGASEDLWSDNDSQYLSCKAASKVYEASGVKGLVSPDRLPEIGDIFHEGRIAFHLRQGPHNMGREDWNLFMDYIRKSI